MRHIWGLRRGKRGSVVVCKRRGCGRKKFLGRLRVMKARSCRLKAVVQRLVILAVLLGVAPCSDPDGVQLPLGGDRECSVVIDIAPQCCMEHDNDYWIGGTEEDRLRADTKFYDCMIEWDVPYPIVKARFIAVRTFGKNSFNYWEEPE
jgi:hypothetical protein